MMRGATICSGIGSPELAAPWIDWRWAAEIDQHAIAILQARHGVKDLRRGARDGPKLWGDFTAIRRRFFARLGIEHELKLDILVAGTPCQDFSIAGLRAGIAGERGILTLAFIDLLRRLRPRWFVLENVPGLLSMDEGRAFGAILGRLADSGYGFAYRILDARYFGVPQRRERIFVVGYSGDWRPPSAVLFERESLRRDRPPSRAAGEDHSGPLEARAAGGGGAWGTDFLASGGLVAHGLTGRAGNASRQPGSTGNIVPTAFGGNDQRGPIDVATARNGHGSPHGRLDFGTETFVLAFDCKRNAEDSARDDDCAPALRAMSHEEGHHNGGGEIAIAFETRFARNDRGAPSEIVNALKAQAGQTGKGDAAPCTVQPDMVRRLTPRECERLQGFPDDFTRVRYRGKPMADGPRYRTLGNAMAIPCIAWILDRIGRVDAIVGAAA